MIRAKENERESNNNNVGGMRGRSTHCQGRSLFPTKRFNDFGRGQQSLTRESQISEEKKKENFEAGFISHEFI